MSESRLNKEFSQRDIQRMRNIVSGNTADRTRVQAGYQKQSIEHNEGDVWEESGKTWTIKNGIKQTITKHDKLREMVNMPLKCPECERAMKATKLNKKMWLPNVPTFVLKWLLGQMHEIVLESQRVSVQKIKESGYQFKYPDINIVLKDISEQLIKF